MQDIVVVMVTVDRNPYKNYLTETLQNLARSKTWQSERLLSFHLFDSGGGRPDWPFIPNEIGDILFDLGRTSDSPFAYG